MTTFSELPERKTYLRQQKTAHRRHLIGVFPAVYPREILWSLNILPVEIWDPPLKIKHSAAHLPPNVCDVARLGLELILQDHCGDLDGFLFPHTCDSLQNLASIVNDYLDTDKRCFFFHPPRIASGKAVKVFYRQQLKALATDLEDHFRSEISITSLQESVDLGQRIDRQVCDLYARRGQGQLAVDNADFYATLRSGEYLHPIDYLSRLQHMAKIDETTGRFKTSVVLSGILPSPPGMLQLLDDIGLQIVADDLLNCGRRLQVPAGRCENPYETLTERYFRMPVCPTRTSSVAQRIDRLLELIRSTRAAGLIFYVVPFCDPELFDLPQLIAAMNNHDIPTLVVEAGLNRKLSAQVAVRLEAFAEMIGSGIT